MILRHEKKGARYTSNVRHANSIGLDHPAHSYYLIRAFSVHEECVNLVEAAGTK